MSAADDATFEKWVAEISHNPDLPADRQGEIGAEWSEWLRGVFDREGPVSKDVVTRAALTHQLALANDAVTAVLADIQRTSAVRPRVEVNLWTGSAVRIVIDGGFTVPSIWASAQPQALVEVAGYFQEHLDQSPLGCWPECAEHGVGLHPEVHDGGAVWWCRPGSHAVAAIGELDVAPQ